MHMKESYTVQGVKYQTLLRYPTNTTTHAAGSYSKWYGSAVNNTTTTITTRPNINATCLSEEWDELGFFQ